MFPICHEWLQNMCQPYLNFNPKKKSILHETVVWTKKSGNGWQEWQRPCEDARMPPCKFNTPPNIFFASKVILFQDIHKFKHVIVFYYGRQQSLALQGYVPSPQVWVVAKVIVNALRHVVQQCVEPKSRLLVVFSYICCHYITCMSNATTLFST